MTTPQGTPRTSPCPDCRGRCCSAYFVQLTGYDVWRISTSQQLPPENFVRLMHPIEPTGDSFYLTANDEPYNLILDKRGGFKPTSPCIFLMTLVPGQVGKCGIYPHRPAACWTYPVQLMHGEGYLWEASVCPPGGWPQEEISSPARRLGLKRAYMETDLYWQVADRWNVRVAQRPDEQFMLSEYLSYVMNAFDAIARLEKETGEAEMTRITNGWPSPPRTSIPISKVSPSPEAEERPWLHFLRQVYEIVEGFYPQVPPREAIISVAADPY